MSYEKVKQAKRTSIGTKQTLKAIQNGDALEVVIADDADPYVVEPIRRLAIEKQLSVCTVDSMKRLGKVCGIDVGATAVAIKR
ncbi:50S ribosomal protein L7ae-like protein [Aureibacillus halotolerans]|uniref:LSU ribosomal protein L7AE n=1 Tax=Aureibacillus halotolerans TaxID=1508390 RepID=A0A4R6TY26_9BACI|nr:50S ribosomal protein L7ae-like protein [Aureibacillus halotolerans]TDQ34703.1 LSU ribosomal protein L7AE [Aureibacillus halotolerans]